MDIGLLNEVSEVCKSVLHYFGLCKIEMHYFNISMVFIGHALCYFIGKYVVFAIIYRFNELRRKNSVRVLATLNIISAIFWIFAEVTHSESQLQDIITIFSIIYFSKIISHILSFVNLRIYGEENEIKVEITNKIKKLFLHKIHNDTIEECDSNIVKIDDEYIFHKDEDKFYKSVVTKTSTKSTKIIDAILFTSMAFIALSLVLPILGDLNTYLSNSYALPIFAFIFVYVFGSVYPHLYGAFLVIKNRNIELGDFIRIEEKNLKGRIIEVAISWVILKDHTKGTLKIVPTSYFHLYVVENLSKFQTYSGKKEVLTYVLGFDLYNKDNGKRIKTIFCNILDELETEIKAISKGGNHNLWITSDNDGVKITIWYFVTNIEKEEKIKLDVEDFILTYCTNLNIDLRTPKLLEVVPSDINRKIKRKRG